MDSENMACVHFMPPNDLSNGSYNFVLGLNLKSVFQVVLYNL
jgi:hypothetical protein